MARSAKQKIKLFRISQKIDYKFSPEQAMYLIHEGRQNSLSEKHAAYKQLIALYPDHPLKERREGSFRGQTLETFLTEYIARENKLFKECLTTDNDAIYSASYFSNAEGAWVDNKDKLFHTYQARYDNYLCEDYVCRLRVCKRYSTTTAFCKSRC